MCDRVLQTLKGIWYTVWNLTILKAPRYCYIRSIYVVDVAVHLIVGDSQIGIHLLGM